MFVITTEVFDPLGRVLLDEDPNDSNVMELQRRFSKTQTLDGDVSIEDRGFVHGDRTFRVSVKNPTLALSLNLQHIIETYSRVLVHIDEGTFRVLPSRFLLEPDEARLFFEVESKVSA